MARSLILRLCALSKLMSIHVKFNSDGCKKNGVGYESDVSRCVTMRLTAESKYI